MSKQQVLKEYKELLYDYSVPAKDKRKRLRQYERDLVQFATIKKDDFFYRSWGYDQTNIDFLQIVEVSPTKKTVLCQMVGKHRNSTERTGDHVSPDDSYKGETVFRLRVTFYADRAGLTGTYPAHEKYWPECKLADTQKDKGFFQCPIIETRDKNFFRWNTGMKHAYCKGCKNQYEKLHISHNKGSFSPYTTPMYETTPQFGH